MLSACPHYFGDKFERYRRVTCFKPSPLSTRGEAEFAARYAERNQLDDVTVITTKDQVTRARLRFKNCWHGHLAVIAAKYSPAAEMLHVPYETLAYLKAETWNSSC